MIQDLGINLEIKEDEAVVSLQTMCMHPQWCSIVPWSLASVCKAIASGQYDMEVPLTVDGRQQLVALSTIRRLELSQVLLLPPNPHARHAYHMF